MNILLAVDGSDHSLAAAETIANRPWPPGSAVKISFGRQAGRLRRLRRPDQCPTATDYALSDSDREMKENCHDHQRNNARNLAVQIRLHLPRVMNESHSPRMYAIELDFRLRAFDARSRPNSLRVKAVAFKAQQRRSFLSGLFRDFLMMLVTAILLMLSIGAGTFLALARSIGTERLPVAAPTLEFVWGLTAKLLALGLLASLFYVLYRYAPARRLSRGALLVASLSATVLFEFARWAFNWYVAFAYETLTLYGVLSGLMFFFFWLYYASLVFVLGAEIGFAYQQTRLLKTAAQDG